MMNQEVIFSRFNRRNRPMERRKFKSHLPAAAYVLIFLIYIIYLFVGAGKFTSVIHILYNIYTPEKVDRHIPSNQLSLHEKQNIC